MPFEVRTEIRALALGALGLAVLQPVAVHAKAHRDTPPALAESGPAADYPMVLGDPFTVDGRSYTPADTLNYDAVGQAHVDADTDGVTASHRTLPLPSYVEVTSLGSGRTALVRVTRRGPMAGTDLVALSPATWAQLGLDGARAPVRVRRVNPPEAERALLRAGQRAPDRMETPAGLLAVLRRKLGEGEGAVLSSAPRPAVPVVAAVDVPIAPPAPKDTAKRPVTAAPKKPTIRFVAAPPVKAPAPSSAAVAATPAKPLVIAEKPAPAPARAAAAKSGYVVQVGAFGAKDRAEQVARKAGASVTAAGKLFRVRMGPFADAAEAKAALAKAKAGGYAGAQVLREP